MGLIEIERLKDDIAVLLERNKKLIDPWLANCIDDTIEEQAVIEAEPVRRGKWTRYYHSHREGDFSINCSLCFRPVLWPSPYCPQCGARMEEQE